MRLNKSIFILIIFLILLGIANAQSNDSSVVEVELISDDASFTSNLVYSYSVFKGETVVVSGRASMSDGKLNMNVPDGYYDLVILIDDVSTNGYDFVGKKSSLFPLTDEDAITLVALPVGSLSISIEDLDGKFVENALIRVDCERNYGAQGYYKTDEFGAVNIDYLPIGKCMIRGAYEEFTTKKIITIQAGHKEDVQFVYSGRINETKIDWFTIILIILVACLITLGIVFAKSKKSNKEIIKDDSDNKPGAAKVDIISALNRKEKLVVEYLLEENLKHVQSGNVGGFHVSQANIIYGAGLPKTSLVRVLNSLEQKNIIIIEKFGKMKKISFSEWFESK